MRRWVGIPRLGWGCLVKRDRAPRWVLVPAGAPRAEPTNASAWVRPERDQTLRPRRPMSGAINPNHRTGAQRPEGSAPATERCPTGQGLKHSNPLDWTGDGGLHQLRLIRSALLAESYVKSAAAAFPRGRPFQRANQIRQVIPGQQGSCPQISMVGNLGKAKQHGHYHNLRSRKRGPAPPPRRFSPKC